MEKSELVRKDNAFALPLLRVPRGQKKKNYSKVFYGADTAVIELNKSHNPWG